MKGPNTYKQNHLIQDRETDFNGNLKISTILSLIQDISAQHSKELGCSREKILEERGVVWILMRMRVEIKKMPRLFDEIILETWPLDPKKRYERESVIKDKDGNVLVSVSSLWIVMNLEKRMISRERVMDGCTDFREDKATEQPASSIKINEDLSLAFSRKILPSDIDVNKHVNNSVYADLILDCLGIDFIVKETIKVFEINYLHELSLDDEVEIYCNKNSNIYTLTGKVKSKDIVAFKARITI